MDGHEEGNSRFHDCVNAPEILRRMSKIVSKSNIKWNLRLCKRRML